MSSEHERIVEQLAAFLIRPSGWNLWPEDARSIAWEATVFLLHQGWLAPQEVENLRKELAIARDHEQQALDTLTELEVVKEQRDLATMNLHKSVLSVREMREFVRGDYDERD